MRKIKPFLALIFCVFFFGIINAQTVDISGKVIGKSDVDGIHVINKSAQKFTITNSKGEFLIPTKLHDTILFSGVSYQPKELIITLEIIKSKSVTVELSELVNELDEVVVGKVLSGDLLTDIKESGAKAKINFYDLGIPGYIGKPMTQVERKLYEATSGGGFLPLNPIINYLSGRTKMLKSHVKFEKAKTCMDEVITKFADMLFENETIEEPKMIEFFYFASDDERFLQLCKSKNELLMYEFLQQKLKIFKTHLEESKD